MIKLSKKFDWTIFLITVILLFLGLVTIRSIVPSLVIHQIIWAILGLGLFFIFSQIDYRNYQRFSWFFYFGSIAFLLMTFLFGTITRGALRWIQIGSLRIQPSELVKPFLILFFASFLSENEKNTSKKIFQSGILLGLLAFLVFLQPDLGSSLVIIFIWLGMVLARGIRRKWLIFGGGFLAFFLPLAWWLLKDYQKQRVYAFLDPSGDPLGSGFNLIQSIIAIGSGQIFGRGLGRGTQSHLKFLPERHTDFIFASLAEELGFLGAMILISLFFFLLLRVLNLAKNSSDNLAYLICIGVFSLLFIQIFVNIGMNLGLLPITGITLPLISYGGSSLISTMIALGIIENIARAKRKEETVEIR